MADQNITALPVSTTPESSDQLLLVGATEEKLIDYDKLADAILNKLTSKNFSLDQGTMPLISALNQLNSNRFFATEQTISGIKVAKGSTVEKEFEFPVKTGYTRHYILSSIAGTGSNTAVINAHFSVVSVYAPMIDSEVSVKVMCIYTKD